MTSCRQLTEVVFVVKQTSEWTVNVSAHEGDYWRLLIPGTYTVTACADEQYKCVSKEVVIVNHPHTEAQIVDFTLPLAELEQQASLFTGVRCIISVYIICWEI